MIAVPAFVLVLVGAPGAQPAAAIGSQPAPTAQATIPPAPLQLAATPAIATPVAATQVAVTPAAATAVAATPVTAAQVAATPAGTTSTAAPSSATTPAATTPGTPAGASTEPQDRDVVVDVPSLKLEKLGIDVEKLKSRLAIDAKVAQYVSITAGIDAQVDTVKMTLEGVEAQTRVVIRLGRVADIMEHALDAIDKNPDLALPSAAAPSASTRAVPLGPVPVLAGQPAPAPAAASRPVPPQP